MRPINRFLLVFLVFVMLFGLLASCATPAVDADRPTSLTVENGGRHTLTLGESLQLVTDLPDKQADKVEWSASNECVFVFESGLVLARKEGTCTVTATYGELSDFVLIEVVSQKSEGGDESTAGSSSEVTPKDETPEITTDIYADMSKEAFYADYEEASCYLDAYYRSQHGLMSGSLEVSDQAPTLSSYRPMKQGLYVRNSIAYFEDENTYVVVDAYGNEVMEIYRGGGYITLEEVAAYVYAFGDVPANYVASKKVSPTESVWGEYLRLNHSAFSGDTSKYPYEPVLPRISGCGGDLYYYEIDIGTTGTDCDPKYDAVLYNDGYSIERGAARIVYTRFDRNYDHIDDPNERYVFYTYNHYNDFQEYLNYYGGWGEMFGNITGGGVISSKYTCNPTPYVLTYMDTISRSVATAFVMLPSKRRFAA